MSTALHPMPTSDAVPAHARVLEELQLLRQVAAREPQAFDILYHRYAPFLRCFLRRRLPHPDLVDEVCHDVLLVAWQQAERFEPKARLTTWLCGIARHRAYKAWQRVARQQAAPHPTAPAEDTAADPAVLLLHLTNGKWGVMQFDRGNTSGNVVIQGDSVYSSGHEPSRKLRPRFIQITQIMYKESVRWLEKLPPGITQFSKQRGAYRLLSNCVWPRSWSPETT